MAIDNYLDCTKKCRPSIKITDTGDFSTYEKLCYVLDKQKETIDYVNEFDEEIESKENSINITNNRKLSEIGDFTGSWFGKSLNYILSLISNNVSKKSSLPPIFTANRFMPKTSKLPAPLLSFSKMPSSPT